MLGKIKILLFLKQKRLMLFPKEGLQFQGILIISSIVPLQKEDEDTLLAPILVVKETGDNEKTAQT